VYDLWSYPIHHALLRFIQIAVFWNVTPYSLAKDYRHFGRTVLNPSSRYFTSLKMAASSRIAIK
jgi:hypothetical protein